MVVLVAACAAFSLAYAPSARKVAVLDEGDAPAPNRTEALIQWADKCTQVVPEGLNMQKDCFNLAIAGAGSRTIYDLAKKEGWTRAAHHHDYSVVRESEKTPAPRCYVVQLREPAARLESYYKDKAQKGEIGGTIDETFEKKILKKDPHSMAERSYQVNWYFRNYSGVEGPMLGKKNPKRAILKTEYYDWKAFLWGSAKWYNEHDEETQVPGIDTSSIFIDEDEASPATVDAPLIDCVEKQIVIGFLCSETLVPSFNAFVNSTKAGEPLQPPAGFQVGKNPDIDDSKYPEPLSKFKLSDKNRQLWNDVFMFDDMALYRHFCLGDVDESLVQLNKDIGGEGTTHRALAPGV